MLAVSLRSLDGNPPQRIHRLGYRGTYQNRKSRLWRLPGGVAVIAIPRPIVSVVRRGWRERSNFESLRVLPLLTIVLLLTATPDQWYLRGPMVALFALGVVYRRWLSAPAFW